MTHHTQHHTENSALTDAVLQKIEQEHIAQVPKWQFTLGEALMWSAWAVSVFLGALAFSVIIFFTIHAQFAPYEATHDHLFGFLLAVMPYAWVGAFVLMALLAHYNLRHTRHGYKFEVWQVLLSSLIVSLMGGMVLHTAGVGFRVDHLFASRVPLFPAFSALELRMWQHPQEGRMVGTFKGETQLPHIVAFTDLQGQEWELDVQELNAQDMKTLHEKHKVRIVGLVSSSSDRFHGCGVFPWIGDQNLSRQELKKEREAFVERMREHHEAVLDVLLGEEEEIMPASLCASHAAVMRIREKTQR